MEEVGEVADAMAWPQRWNLLHWELIQVAAVAMSWRNGESFDFMPHLAANIRDHLRVIQFPQSTNDDWLRGLMSQAGDVARAVNEGREVGDLLMKVARTASAWACEITMPSRLRG